MRLVILCFLLGMLAFACSNEQTTKVPAANPPAAPKAEPTFADFQIRGLTGGGWCKFLGIIGTTNFLIDSMPTPQDGHVILKQDTALPGGLYFLLLPDQQVLQFLLDQDQTFTLVTEYKNLYGAAKVEGSLDNQLLYENLVWEENFQKEFQPVSQQLAAATPGTPEHNALTQQQKDLIAKRMAHIRSYKEQHPNTFFTAYKLAGQNPDLKEPRLPNGAIDTEKQIYLYRQEYWDNTPVSDLRLLHTPIVGNKLNTYIGQITPQTRDSVIKYTDIIVAKAQPYREVFKFVVNWIAIKYHKPENMGMEAVFVHVVDKYFTDALAFWSNPKELADIRKEAAGMRPSLIGKVGQDLKCKNLNRQYETLYGLNSPWTVLWIWNYECEHCQERTPEMKQMLQTYKSRGMEVYALCTGMEEKPWRDFIAKYGIQGFHNVWDPQYESGYPSKYHVDNTPELYLLDKHHVIVAKDLHPNQLPTTIDPLL